MLRKVVILAVVLLCGSLPAFAQGFDYCGDTNTDGVLNIIDIVYLLNSFAGGPAVPSGRGDVDFRAGINLGDVRYLTGYMFYGWDPGGCPPFADYTLTMNADTLYLPTAQVPAGSGTLLLPVVLRNQHNVADLLIPFEVSTLGGTVELDSVHLINSVGSQITNAHNDDHSGVYFFTGINEFIDPGLNLLATLCLHYTDCPGGSIAVTAYEPDPGTFLHYVYYSNAWNSYDDMTIAIPTVLAGPENLFPQMSLVPDTLHFQALVADVDPPAQPITVLSDADPFDWWLDDGPSWIEAAAFQGVSGESVDIAVHTSGLGIGTHYGYVTVYSSEALNAPQQMVVKLLVKAQYPSLDANCDGLFNITDVVAEIQYIFGNGVIPCDPCTGLPIGE